VHLTTTRRLTHRAFAACRAGDRRSPATGRGDSPGDNRIDWTAGRPNAKTRRGECLKS
jgi:hypothetical protein